jgi:hypothetical protein
MCNDLSLSLTIGQKFSFQETKEKQKGRRRRKDQKKSR